MKIISHTLNFEIPEESALTLGKFDGVHKGHQRLMKKILEKKEQGLKAVVFTFEQVQDDGVLTKTGRSILTAEEKRLHLKKMGIDYMIECPFTEQIKQLSPDRFIEEVLVKQLHVKYIAVGPDFRFGYRREGDCRLLQERSSDYGYEVEIIPKKCMGDQTISSTSVREKLKKGEMECVADLLGYSYYVSGTVVRGHQIGRKLGIPTTNILPDDKKMLPPNGVYLTKTIFEEKEIWGITNIGVKPTISGREAKGIETNLFDFNGDLYGRELVVQFFAFKRPERRFESLTELKLQVEEDISWGRKLIDKWESV